MLKVYDVVIEMLKELRPVLDQIGRRDKELEGQLRRAATSVPLNIAEGSGSRGNNRGARYATALGSAREVGAILDSAVALGYIEQAPVRERLHQVIGTLVKVTR